MALPHQRADASLLPIIGRDKPETECRLSAVGRNLSTQLFSLERKDGGYARRPVGDRSFAAGESQSYDNRKS
jgi:hypothetical protein